MDGKDTFIRERFTDFLQDILLWYRFINDLFLVWTGTRDRLLEFVNNLNDNDSNLKFTFNFDNGQTPFLNLSIIKQPIGTLGTDLYRKLTAGNMLLYATSAHPKPLVRRIPFAQYLRLRRNCIPESDFRTQANALRERLLLRGYARTNLGKAFNKALSHPRNSLLFNRPKRPPSNDTVRFITTYSAHHKGIENYSIQPLAYTGKAPYPR